MPLPQYMIKATYRESEIPQYRGNPFIEALPPTLTVKQVRKGLVGTIQFNPKDIFADARTRAHIIASLLDDFFQPLAAHIQLEEKISIMIRRGYVGRNLADGSLSTHMQNGYERVMTGELDVCRFHQAKSTASSLSLIGCSGSGKSTTLNRILATYPQVIFHESYNFTQLTYLKVDCPHDGSLKNLCIQFFRAIDQVLHTDYETKYARKRTGIDTLLAMMSQVANAHAIGVLVIDEIQHLSRTRSGGVEKMLNFFVTLVNVIGLPVVFVGTPKARPIFEKDLRSGRRGAGFGSLLWEPMKAHGHFDDQDFENNRKTVWEAFTDKLWRYQWLQHRDESLTEEVRACWYDLSQGVLDIVVKLFVLAQLRAIATGVERITTELLTKVYEAELMPVHPMLKALRSKDPDEIAMFSDLVVPDIEKKMLEVIQSIPSKEDTDDDFSSFDGNPKAQKLVNLLLSMDCNPKSIGSLVEKVFQEHPDLSTQRMVAMVLEWYESDALPSRAPDNKTKPVSKKDWHKLESKDLRFVYSQAGNDMYGSMKSSPILFDFGDWLSTG